MTDKPTTSDLLKDRMWNLPHNRATKEGIQSAITRRRRHRNVGAAAAAVAVVAAAVVVPSVIIQSSHDSSKGMAASGAPLIPTVTASSTTPAPGSTQPVASGTTVPWAALPARGAGVATGGRISQQTPATAVGSCTAAQTSITGGPRAQMHAALTQWLLVKNTSAVACAVPSLPTLTPTASGGPANWTLKTLSVTSTPVAIPPGATGEFYLSTGTVCTDVTTWLQSVSVDLTGGPATAVTLERFPLGCGTVSESPIGLNNTVLPTPIPTTSQTGLATQISAPATLRHTGNVQLTASLTNPTAAAISLSPCPDVTISVGSLDHKAVYGLNCAAAPSNIQPGQTVTFAVDAPMPGGTPLGQQSVQWNLTDASGTVIAGGAANVTIT